MERWRAKSSIAKKPPFAFEYFTERLGDRALVVRVAALLGEQPQRLRERRVLKRSPSRGARPPGMNTSAKPGLSLKREMERSQSTAITGESGKPSSA